MKLQSLLPALITAAFLSTTFGGVIYSESAVAAHGDILETIGEAQGGKLPNNYFTTTHVPGDKVGKSARPAIKHRVEQGMSQRYIAKMTSHPSYCENELRHTVEKACSAAGAMGGELWKRGMKPEQMCFSSRFTNLEADCKYDLCAHEWGGLGWDSSKGVAYIQSTGGYCYYYTRGTSSGPGGQNLWRYDTKKCNGTVDFIRTTKTNEADHWGCKK